MIFSGSLWLVALFRVHVCERPEVGGAEVRQMEEGERVTRKEYRGHKVDKVGGVGLEAVELCVTCPGLDSQLPDSGLAARESSDLPFPSQLITLPLVTDSPNPLCLQP